MARAYTLEVVSRDQSKKAKALRRESMVPAVVYGPKLEKNFLVAIEYQKVTALLEKALETSLVGLVFKNEKGVNEEHEAFIKSVQRDKTTDKVIHIDFYVPANDRKMTINIPFRFTGVPAGVTKGGVLQTPHHNITVELYPSDVLETITVDVSAMNINDHKTVADIIPLLPHSAKVHMEETEVIAAVTKQVIVDTTAEGAVEEGAAAPGDVPATAQKSEKKEEK
ncbi:MAG TPA: 50S ribosomal protein L25 [Petrotogaceae bacterium]|nr:50S ribosomal protein L25 [Petrotogaceae bacterium]